MASWRIRGEGSRPRCCSRARSRRRRWPSWSRAWADHAGDRRRGGSIQGGSRALGSLHPGGRFGAAQGHGHQPLQARPRRAAMPLTRSGPSTCALPTPRSPAAHVKQPMSTEPRHDPHARLLGPAAGDRDRAARVPDAVVAGDVRARAVQALRGVPGAIERATVSCVGYLICSRYADVWHLMNIAVDPAARRRGHRRRAARGDDRARRAEERRTRSRSGPRTPARSRCTSGSASARPARGGATTRTPARTR